MRAEGSHPARCGGPDGAAEDPIRPLQRKTVAAVGVRAGLTSMEDYMREIVDVGAFERALLVVALAGPVVGVAVGALAGWPRKRAGWSALQGLCVGLLGAVVYGLWQVYDYLTRYDPETNYVGLHRVSALALSAFVFIAVGVGCAVALRALFRPAPQDAPGEMSE